MSSSGGGQRAAAGRRRAAGPVQPGLLGRLEVASQPFRSRTTFKDSCRPYDGPALTFLVAACKVADGSYWAIQSWQRRLPHRVVIRGRPLRPPGASTSPTGPDNLRIWCFPSSGRRPSTTRPSRFSGSPDYAGQPVHGFGTTRSGVPTDAYGRGVYIDTLDSAYGSGWKRETSIVFRNPTGAFCYSFYPTTTCRCRDTPTAPRVPGRATGSASSAPASPPMWRRKRPGSASSSGPRTASSSRAASSSTTRSRPETSSAPPSADQSHHRAPACAQPRS